MQQGVGWWAKIVIGVNMGVYNRRGEIQLISAILDAAQYDVQDGVLVEALLEVVGVEDVMEHLKIDEVLEWLGENKTPAKVFTQEELEEWAHDNDFVSAAEMDNYDPDGYEERERY